MVVTAWNNGNHNPSGAGYGLKLISEDRDKYFKKEWAVISLKLDNRPEPIEININKKSFWNNCRDLISKEIGVWLLSNNLAP